MVDSAFEVIMKMVQKFWLSVVRLYEIVFGMTIIVVILGLLAKFISDSAAPIMLGLAFIGTSIACYERRNKIMAVVGIVLYLASWFLVSIPIMAGIICVIGFACWFYAACKGLRRILDIANQLPLF